MKGSLEDQDRRWRCGVKSGGSPRRSRTHRRTRAVRAFDAAGVEITGISLAEPTLDEVYLALAEQRADVPVPS
jgi:hypothetical protein